MNCIFSSRLAWATNSVAIGIEENGHLSSTYKNYTSYSVCFVYAEMLLREKEEGRKISGRSGDLGRDG